MNGPRLWSTWLAQGPAGQGKSGSVPVTKTARHKKFAGKPPHGCSGRRQRPQAAVHRLCCMKFFSSNSFAYLPPKTPAHVVQVCSCTSIARKPSKRQASQTCPGDFFMLLCRLLFLQPFTILLAISFLVQNSPPRCRRHLQHWNDDGRHFAHIKSEWFSCAAF